MGTIDQIWRYPIKSTGGERLREAEIDARGIVGDRRFAVRDGNGKFCSGKNTRRFRRMDGLLHLSSRLTAEGPRLFDPRGRAMPDAGTYLRAYLGRDDVDIAEEGDISHFDQLALSVLTTATLDWLADQLPGIPVDARRFRPNIVVRTPPGTRPFAEDGWFGRKARAGRARIAFDRASIRCVMVDAAQPDLPYSPLVLRTLARAHDSRLDALAEVVTPGTIRLGDEITLL
ncbi:MOSC N-terminal beta barrel domain-containing protein [Nocardia sp. NPDC050712]|uniref:MOSC domain-containing protein n=1 Tax=Nocardia sp. NPDC050712 TaxID=3155518 RepID=UPI0034111845